MKTRVIIYVDGGIVQEMKADTDDIEVDVLDLDNKEAAEAVPGPERRGWAEEAERLQKLEEEYDKLPFVVL